MKGCPHNGDKALNGKRYCSPCFVKELRRIWYPRHVEPGNGNSNMEVDVMTKKKVVKKQAAKAGPSSKPKKEGRSLADIIDPMLLAGGKTIKDIAAELARKAGEAAKGKDLEANVRARLYMFRRKGYAVKKDDTKRIMVVATKAPNREATSVS